MLMDYRPLCRKAFNAYVDGDLAIPSELRHSLRGHERMPRFIDNLALELEKIQNLRVRKGKKPFADEILSDLVQGMTRVFIQGIMNEARRRYESDFDRIVREGAERDRKEIEDAANGKITGDFAEAGLVQLDSRSDDGRSKNPPQTEGG